MTAIAQDFLIYSGDSANPIFTIYTDETETVVQDISTVSEIVWTLQRDLSSAAVITKTKSASGGVTFVTSGTDGQFQIALTPLNTTTLSGYYVHQAKITDALGNISTVTLGRLNIGRAPIWTYSGDPSASRKDAVRFLVGDTISTDPQLQDGEIEYVLTIRPTIYGAAAQCCRSLSSQYSRKADSVQADLRTTYSSIAKAYSMRAVEYETREAISGTGSQGLLYAGGISQTDKSTREQDTDRVNPAFNIGMTDNNIPIGPAGTEHPNSDTDSN